MNKEIKKYNDRLEMSSRLICDTLCNEIDNVLVNAECKVWHAHPVWFLDGNPVVGYAKLKENVQLLFWSGQSFEEEGLENEGSFKASQKRYKEVNEINKVDLERWLKKSIDIQWDYKNIVKRKGSLERLK
jgi:hypothetical protein